LDLLFERDIVNNTRHQRLRTLLKDLNQQRKKQAKQIDILCNDIITAQRDFIKRLKTIDFRANFYESIMGTIDLNCLLSTAAAIIKEETDEANVVFFLRHVESFEIYTFDGTRVNVSEEQRIENSFNPELMTNICMSNKVCRIEDMFAMGLQGNLTCLNTISAVTIPLGSSGSVQGFMLIYRSLEKKLTSEEIRKISSISSGLSQVIYSCLTLMHSSD
jgi:transcriptional regulator with GAF, ATPase, and Fis domain